MPNLPFYGFGPNTNVHASVRFSQRDTSAGIEITTPFPEVSWLSAGGRIEGLWPDIGGVTGSKIISIQQVYTAQTAPGLVAQPALLHDEILLRPHHRLHSRVQINYK